MQCASSSSEDNIIYMRVLVPILISVIIIVAIAIPNEPKASKACPGFQGGWRRYNISLSPSAGYLFE